MITTDFKSVGAPMRAASLFLASTYLVLDLEIHRLHPLRLLEWLSSLPHTSSQPYSKQFHAGVGFALIFAVFVSLP